MGLRLLLVRPLRLLLYNASQCPGQDLNLHAPTRGQRILSPPRLPISPPGPDAEDIAVQAAAAFFGPAAPDRYPAAAQSDTIRSSVPSGTMPDPRTVSWNALMSNRSPRVASASRRIRWISSRPSMYDNACPGMPM